MKKEINGFKVKSIVIGEGTPKVCMPLVGKTEAELLAGAEEVKALGPDVVEWRADYFQNVEAPGELAAAAAALRAALPDMPLLFTLRDVSEGGFAKINPENRKALIGEMIDSGKIDLVDIELEAVKNGFAPLVAQAKKQGVGVIMSNHFFTRTPAMDEIVDILRQEQANGADIAKIAVMPNSPADVLTLLSATDKMYTEYAEIPLITMSMGALGLPSRICGGIFGSSLTFGAGQNTSAPGQIGVQELHRSLALFH